MHFLSQHRWLRGTAIAAAALLTGCNTVERPAVATGPAAPAAPSAPALASAPVPARPANPAATAGAAAPATVTRTVSSATTPKAYRYDAARHLYEQNAGRIYKGMLQPNLYAVAVLEVDIDRQGQVASINWRRAPDHVPEVMAEIIRTVRAAAPYPIPSRMGRVTYTDIWLWDKSGKFQLDTLTEGQL